MNHHDKGQMLPVDHDLVSVKPDAFDALLLPGGVANPDALRVKPKAVAFVKHFVDAGKPIAAIRTSGWGLSPSGDSGMPGRARRNAGDIPQTG